MKQLTPWPRRAVVPVAALVLAAASMTALTQAPAQAAVSCSATYTVTNAWSGGFQGSVSVRNTGDAVTSWTVGFSMPSGATVTQGWGGTWTTGAQLAFGPEDERWNIAAFVRNLENNRIVVNTPLYGLASALTNTTSAPRTYGVRVNFNF